MSASAPPRRSPRLASPTSPPTKGTLLNTILELGPELAEIPVIRKKSIDTPSAHRRSRRLAGLPPTPTASRTANVVSSKKVSATAIGREAYRMYPVAECTPDVTDTKLFDCLLNLAGYVIHAIFKKGLDGRRGLTKDEMYAWVHERHNVMVLAGVIRSWMFAPSGIWRVRYWDEEHVEIALRQNPQLMELLEAAMA
jgi:hypothetical protein